MAAPRIDIEQVAFILAEAAIHGAAITAKRHGIHPNTVSRYRKRLETDGELVTRVECIKKRLLAEWESGAIRLQVKLQAKLEALVEEATIKNFRELVGNYKINGELLVAKGVLGGGQSSAHREGPAPEAPPSGERLSTRSVH